MRIGIPLVKFATALTYLNPVECEICLPLKFVNSFVDIPINGFLIVLFIITRLILYKFIRFNILIDLLNH